MNPTHWVAEEIPMLKWVGSTGTYSDHEFHPWSSVLQLGGNSQYPTFHRDAKGMDHMYNNPTVKTDT